MAIISLYDGKCKRFFFFFFGNKTDVFFVSDRFRRTTRTTCIHSLQRKTDRRRTNDFSSDLRHRHRIVLEMASIYNHVNDIGKLAEIEIRLVDLEHFVDNRNLIRIGSAFFFSYNVLNSDEKTENPANTQTSREIIDFPNFFLLSLLRFHHLKLRVSFC